jgi:hypothetical protein
MYKITPAAVVEYKIAFTWEWLNTELEECKITDGYHAEAIHQNKNKISVLCVKRFCIFLTTFNNFLNSKSQHSFM